MNAFAAAGAGFLLAVLWFDLMFDVQLRAHRGETIPPPVLASISAYYRRVTTDASPMGSLVAGVMALVLIALADEIVVQSYPWWIAWLSLAAATAAFGLTLARTVPCAVRIGRAVDTADEQTRLARTVYRDHLCSLAAMVMVLVLQLAANV